MWMFDMNKFLDKIGLSYFYSKIMEQIARQSIPPGGKTGQVLMKRSDDNYDCYWGDVENVTVSPPEPEGTYEWWSPKMTSNSAPAPYVCEASSFVGSLSGNSNSTYATYKAFDGDSGNTWSSDSHDTNIWISFDFGKNTYVAGIRLYPRVNLLRQTPTSGVIVGSYDKNDWKEITSFAIPQTTTTNLIDFAFNPVKYRYYKLSNLVASYSNDGNAVSIGDIEFSVLGGEP